MFPSDQTGAKIIAESLVIWIGKKVKKAHQDDNQSYDQLDSWAKANVLVDNLAEEHMARIKDQPRTPRYIQRKEDGWIICADGNIIMQNFDKVLTLHCTKQSAQEYWCNRMKIPPEYQEAVDWKNFMKTTTYLLPYQQLFL